MISIHKAGWLSKKLLLIPLIIIITACSDGASDKELMERAKVHLQAHDLNAATLELKNILRNDAKNAEARYLLGRINLRLGDVKTAQKELQRAMDAGWDEAAVNVLLAEVFFRRGEYQTLRNDIPIKNNYPDEMQAELLGLWASAEMRMGKWEDAAQTLKSGELITKDSLWLLQSKIQLALHSNDLETAGQALEHALQVHPESQDLWLISAGVAEKGDDLTQANVSLQKVIDLDPPKYITAWGRQARLSQSQIMLKQQDYLQAQAIITPVLSFYPGDPLANYMLAMVAFKQGEYEQAEERILKALKVVPEHRPSLLLFGALNYARNDYQQAAYYLEKAAVSQPEDLNAQALLGRTYMMLGQYDAAEDRLIFASEKMGGDAELLALVGISKLKRGNTQAGIQELEQAAAAAPADTAIRSELARAYIATGESALAIKELELALEENTDGKKQQYSTKGLLLLAYLKAGEFDKALDLAHNLSEQLPDNPLPHNLTGVAYEGKQNLAAARDSYNIALGIQPGDVMAIMSLARLDLNDGHIDTARKRYHSVLDIDPNNASAMVELANLSSREGDLEKALELLETAAKVDEKALHPRLILSNYYLNKGMSEKALSYANEALVIAPQDVKAMYAVGRAELRAGQPIALQSLQELSERLPDSPNVLYYLAMAQDQFGNGKKTQQSLQKILELQPDHMPALRSLGKLHLGKDNFAEALKFSQKLKKASPEGTAGYLLEGDVLLAKDNKKGALKAYQSALSYARSGEATIKISKVHKLLGDVAASNGALLAWLEKHPSDLTVRFVLSMSYLAAGKDNLAISQLEQILEKQPDNSTALNDLAWLYYKVGKKGALEMAEKAYRLAPDNPAIQDTYGWILVQKGMVESGLIALEQAISNLPNSPDIRYHLAVALAKVGEKNRAREELSLALKSKEPFGDRVAAEKLQQELIK